MAEENTVVKTVENIDQLFPEIVVNGESHVSDRYVPPTIQPQTVTLVVQEETPQESTPAQSTQGEDVYAVELNAVLHDFVDRAVTQGLADEVLNRQNADSALEGDINDIKDLIPNQASDTNQLADKNFVNSSIATNTANFLGTYTSLADIEAIPDPTNNDYAYLDTTDSAGNVVYKRYKYNADDQEWLFEYDLNNSSFTAEQWATINSGLTQQSVDEDIQEAIQEGLSALDDIPVGLVTAYYGNNDPANGKWLICDGRDTTGTDIELETHYPSLYIFLGGTNVLPDLRECALVGIGQNGINTIATHDVYTLGQFKDDQMQKITATANMQGSISNGTATGAMAVTSRGYHASGSSQATNYINNINFDSSRQTRTGTPNVTHGKQKGVNWIIKATASTDTVTVPSAEMQEIKQYFDEGLSRAESYSTTETWTGGYWYDGKKIFRKVFDGLSFGGTAGSWTNTGATLSNVDSLVKGIALRKNSSQNSIINAMNFQMSGTNIQYYLTTSTFGSCSSIVIEYTKTTD